jgi:DNA anti-recombination protein RmuC
MSAYQQMIQEQLEEGLRALQHTANTLMHEIASEVWRTAGGDKDEAQSKLLEALSRDQSIRSLIAHTDERFQALAVRTARVEDTLNMLAEGIRSAKEELARGVVSLEEMQDSPAARGVEDVRAQLNEVTRKIAQALETLAERDKAVVETVQRRVQEHGELVSTETAAITRAMESYVQQGVAVMGQLASDVDRQLATIGERDEEIAVRISATAREQLALLEERLGGISQAIAAEATRLDDTLSQRIGGIAEQLVADATRLNASISERMDADATAVNAAIERLLDTTDERNRSMYEYLELMHDRVGMEARDVLQAVETSAHEVNVALEARVKGLAKLVRSDSVALREQLVRTASEQDAALARTLDERLGRVNETLATATDWMVDEISRRIREDAVQAIRMRLDEAIATIDRRGEETSRILSGRLDDAVVSIDRNMVRMADTLEGQLERLARTVGDRADEAVGRAQLRTEEVVGQAVDARVAALAKMVRSDNESLARQIVADQEASKQALRAMKELQASLPADVIETIQRRMDDLAESVAKSQEMLAQRIDRMAAKIGERYDNDIQIVIDRMGDAMHALASLGRTPQGAEPERIELE